MHPLLTTQRAVIILKNCFNCINDNVTYDNFYYFTVSSEDIFVSIHNTEGAIKKLDLNKSCGLDGIYAEHLKYCSKRVLPLLALCITCLAVNSLSSTR